MRGWFDAFRTAGGPTLYHESNRTAAHGDKALVLIAIVFLTLLTGFLLIFPGVRSQRVTTFSCVLLSLFTGLAITLGATGSNWQSGSVRINTIYRAFSADRLEADLAAHIGLDHVNITLTAMPSETKYQGVDFNERFSWHRPTQMREEYRAALVKGLPYPILTVAEHLSASAGGYAWGGQLRSAGYYTSVVIWTAFASWVLMNLLMVTVPRYGAYLTLLTGALMCAACALYIGLRPAAPPAIQLEGAALTVSLAWQFYLVLVAGVLCILFGMTASVVDLVYPHTFSTILEVDFGTPYDRHVLIVESEESRRRPTLKIPKLEEPITAGIEATTKLIRRLSKRGKDDSSTNPRGGADNVAFEMDVPRPPPLSVAGRSDSKQSCRSVLGRGSSNHLEVPSCLDGPPLPAPPPPAKRPLQRAAASCAADSRRASSASSASSGSFARTSLPDGEHPSFSEQFKRIRRAESRRDSSLSGSSADSAISAGPGLLTVPVESCPSGGDSLLHPPLEKRDSRSSNIIVFHTQDARGQLTRRQSSDRASLEP